MDASVAAPSGTQSEPSLAAEAGAAPAGRIQPAAGAEQGLPKQKRGAVARFIRSVISHLVFAAIVTAAVLGYLYQRDILGRLAGELCAEDRLGGYMTKAQRPAALQPGEAGPAAVSSPAPASPAAAPSSVPAAPIEESPAAAAQPPLAPSAAEPAKSEPAPQHAVAGVPSASLAQEPAPSQPSAPAEPAASLPLPPLAPAESAKSRAAAAPAAIATSKPREADMMVSEWQAARQAFAGHKADAADLYRALVAKHPGNAELRGEYGNVLYAMGRTKDAAEQYYEAASLQLKGPQPGLAACLETVIAAIEPARAAKLREQIVQPCPYQAR
ncbi:MAG: tetratricopeptide repeat protein [Rhodomicrobium sp.]